ncbi:hypothetical protein RV01_GL002449 [Enterococcus dispar]|nr:hypothetical protein RV01_GL002449 [Enterococcus dispar]
MRAQSKPFVIFNINPKKSKKAVNEKPTNKKAVQLSRPESE